MNALGFRGDFHPRSFQGKFSMLFLNVRNVVVLITIASNTPVTVREKLSPLDDPGKSYCLVFWFVYSYSRQYRSH